MTDDPVGWLSRFGLSVAGAGLVVAKLAYASAEGIPVFAELARWGFGLALALCLAGIGVAVGRGEYTAADRRRVYGWTAAGTAFLLVAAGWLVAFQWYAGATLADAGYGVATLGVAGSVAGAVVGVHDARRRRAVRDSEERSEHLVFLTGLLRHNILNGVNVITGRAERAAERADAGVKEDLSVIRRRAEGIADLVETVTLVVGRSDPPKRRVNVSGLLRVEAAKLRDVEPGVAIRTDIPEEVYVEAGRGLRDVFESLLVNAVEHNPGRTPRVVVSVEAGDPVRVRIADNGPGVEDDRKEAIFQRTEADIGVSGMGSGLYLASELVDRYDGTIHVEDATPEEGGGAAFVVTLPAAPAEPEVGGRSAVATD